MTHVLALFLHPASLSRVQQMLMLLPLCLSISLVYKTTKCERVRDIPWATLVSWVTIVVGMYLVGIGLWVAYQLLA